MKPRMRYPNDLLLGAGRLLDLWGVIPTRLPVKTDAEALREDWEAVGRDMENAIRDVWAETEKK